MSTLTKPTNAEANRIDYITPRVDLHQSGESYTLEVEMPGVGKDGVDVSIEDGKLTLTGHRREVSEPGNALYRERDRAGYRRVFDLDPSIDVEKITASIDQGLLTVEFRKAEAAKPRRITVS